MAERHEGRFVRMKRKIFGFLSRRSDKGRGRTKKQGEERALVVKYEISAHMGNKKI